MKTGNSYYEKGVDVQIAIDLLIGAYEDRYEQAILISSDTDLLPAIKKCQSLGKSVCYVGFKKAMSYALKNQCDKSILLTKEDIEPFVQTS